MIEFAYLINKTRVVNFLCNEHFCLSADSKSGFPVMQFCLTSFSFFLKPGVTETENSNKKS